MRDAATLGVAVSAADAARLWELTQQLARWNRSYNLTSITAPEQMLTHHLLDSLSVHPQLQGTRIADVGTGAGFPGLPLAVCNPARQFTLIDANGKKIRFVSHAARHLGLDNVTALQARVESLTPATPFDTVVARAFAPLPQLLADVAPGGLPHARRARTAGRALPARALPCALAVQRQRGGLLDHRERD